MKLLTKILLAAVMVFASAGLLYDAFGNGQAGAANIDTTRDCDKYAVMYCGSMTKSEMVRKMENGDGRNSGKNIRNIFDKFDLSVKDIKNASFKNGVVYRNGKVKIGDKVVATNAKTYIRTMGKVSTEKMGSAQAAKVALDGNGKFLFAVMTPCGNPVTGKPVEPPKPEPPKPEPPKPEPKPQSLSCDALQVSITDKKNRTVEAKVMGSAQNTTISAYKIDFGDGNTANQQVASHSYANYGKYVITGYVTGMVNGTSSTVSSAACVKEVEFTKPPEPLVQSIVCDAVTLNLYNKDKKYVKVTVSGTADNTTIDKFTIDFDDGTVVNAASAEHTYADWGEYEIKGYVTGKIGSEDVTKGGNGSCVQVVEFKEEIKPCPTNPALPIDDPKCKPCPTNPDLNYDDPNCKEPEVPELPNTGAGAILGLFSGVSLLGAVGHRMWLGRRLN
jgi:hypothetical protein